MAAAGSNVISVSTVAWSLHSRQVNRYMDIISATSKKKEKPALHCMHYTLGGGGGGECDERDEHKNLPLHESPCRSKHLHIASP